MDRCQPKVLVNVRHGACATCALDQVDCLKACDRNTDAIWGTGKVELRPMGMRTSKSIVSMASKFLRSEDEADPT